MLKRRFWGIGAVLLILVLITDRPAQAHPIVVQSDPPDGATLDAAPGQVRLFLNQPVLLDFTTIELVDGDGNHFTPLAILPDTENGTAQASGTGSQVANVLIKMPSLRPNTYRLAWKTRSEDDFHTSEGTIVFGVQRPVSETNSTGPALPSWWEVSLHWLNFGAIAGVIGLLGFRLLVLQKIDSSKSPGQIVNRHNITILQNRLNMYAWRAGWTALGIGVAFLGEQGLTDNFSAERWWELLSGTAFGLRWLAGEVILGLLLGLLYAGTRRLQPALYNGLLIVLLAALSGTVSQNTHAGLPGSSPVLNFLADSLHLFAACLWVGGLAAVLLVLGSNSPGQQDGSGGLARVIVRRFSKPAALSLLILGVTGFYKSGQQIASLDGLLTTLYGQVLLFKVQLVLFAALIGLFNTLILHPRLRNLLPQQAARSIFKLRFLKRALVVEIVTLVSVLGLAAFLSGAEPARGPEFAPFNSVAATGSSSYSTTANDLIVNFSVKPNRPGRNFVDLSVFNTRRPSPAPFEKVRLVLRSPQGQETVIELTSGENGRYQLSGDQLQNAGNWQVQIAVKRANLPVAQANFGWKVLDTQEVGSRRPVVFSNQPLQPWFNLGAGWPVAWPG